MEMKLHCSSPQVRAVPRSRRPGNPKSEIRNPKEARNPKSEKALRVLRVSFRISDFRMSLLTSAATMTIAAVAFAAQEPPTDWIDPDTGHRIIRLSTDPGSASLYFHQNSFTPKGDKFIFDTPRGIVSVDLTRLGKKPVPPELVMPRSYALAVSWKTPEVYCFTNNMLCAVNLN